jgi:hypothetical protein
VVLTKDETFTFVASEPVEWSPNAPSGVFTATTGAGSDHVLATKTKGSDRTATAAVTVAETSLTIQPPLPTLHSGESMRLVARTSAKNPTWTGEICRSDGTCTAPDNLAEERIVTAKVSTSEPKLTASVAIRLVPTPPESKRLLLFAMLFGGLGGLLHAVNSLVAYVGSNTFVPRWGLFYVARPFVGAIIALFVFLVFKGQLSADTLKTTDVFAVAAIASIAGMFSDRAAEKLREIFDAVLGPKNDNRGDKLDPNAPTRPAAAPTPVITALDPAVLTVAQPGLNLTVKGTGFTDKCTATVNGQPRDVTFKSEAELLVTLETADVATQGNLEVVVANPSGAQSGPKSIAVQ